MKNAFIKFSIAIFAVISLFALTACGGGGGGGSSQLPPSTANIKITIPGDLFNNGNPSSNARANYTVPSLKVKANPYLPNGNPIGGNEFPQITASATLKDNDYQAKLNGLSKSCNYRFQVLFGEGANEKVLLQNHVGVASITEGASFDVNIYSSKKVLAYDKWLANNPNKTFDTFLTNCSKEASKKGLSENSYFDDLVNFPFVDFKESLVKITSGQEASLPTEESVNTEKLPAADNSGDNPVNPDNPKNGNLTGKILPYQSTSETSYEVGVYDAAGLKEKKTVNANSSFTFENLPAGEYTLVISSDETLNIIREIIIVGGETKTVTDGRNDYIQASKVQATFTPVQGCEFARTSVYVFVQGGSEVYYQITDGSNGVTIAKQYDEQNKKPLEKDTFDAYKENNVSISTTSKAPGSVKVFFKNSTGEKVAFEKEYPLTMSYPGSAMNETNTGYSLNLTDVISLDLIRCNRDTFVMGSPKDEFGKEDGYIKETQRSVTLTKPFYLGKYEVTIAQYRAVMNYVAAYNVYDESEFDTDINFPVHNVNYKGAKLFCEKLNEMFADSIPQGYKFDLPSEAQWEYACRAGTTHAFNNNNDLIATTTAFDHIDWKTYHDAGLAEIEWYSNNSDNSPHVVGTKLPNEWGFYDMHGNVAEYCRDMYESEEAANYSNTAVTDPCAASANTFVYIPIRGGDWHSPQYRCRSAVRTVAQYQNTANHVDNLASNIVGFRLALVPIQ